MTRQAAAKVVFKISAAFPGTYARLSAEEMPAVVEIWSEVCEAYTGEQVLAALKQYIAHSTTGFAPTPGQLIQYIVAPEDSKDMTEGEAWSMVLRAASNAIYSAQEEFDQLPEIVQRALGSSIILREIAMEDTDSNGVTESHFKRSYRGLLERERTQRRLPPSTRLTLEQWSAAELPGE